MTAAASPRTMLAAARSAMRRSAAKRLVLAAAGSEGESFAIDLEELGPEGAAILCDFAAGELPGSARLRRLTAALERTGSLDRLVTDLEDEDRTRQVFALRILGALRVEPATSWVVPMLDSRDPAVRDAAARSLGRIGGAAAAEALMRSVVRRGPRRMLLAELARCAPDQYLESAIRRPHAPGVRFAAAVAAGLRRRRSAVAPLMDMLTRGSVAERAAACRSLGWIGSATAIAALRSAQAEPALRLSASRALQALLSRNDPALPPGLAVGA